jgi:hypothetical protein
MVPGVCPDEAEEHPDSLVYDCPDCGYKWDIHSEYTNNEEEEDGAL